MTRHNTTGKAAKARRLKTEKPERRAAPAASGRRPSPNADFQDQLEQKTRELAEARKLLAEAMEQQTATTEVLKVISSSPGELAPAFQALLANAVRLCEAQFGVLHRYENGSFCAVAAQGIPPALADHQRQAGAVAPREGTSLDRLMRTKALVHYADESGEAVPGNAARLGGARSLIGVPMLKGDNLIGAFIVYRTEVRPFTDKQIGLVQNFAAQAVIAIENTRLLNELRQRTDDLSEALEQQTATSDVLKVISSTPGELQPVFDTMLAKASELCEASYGALWLCEGDAFRTAAFHGALPAAYIEHWRIGSLFHLGPGVPAVRAAKSGKPVQEADLKATEAYRAGEPLFVTGVDVAGIRTILAVPMLKDNEPVGVIAIYRKEVRPFSDKQIELVSNFAAQAVIAIENTRLLNELRQRTDDLSEALEQQTATSEVLKVISSSPGDLEPVFQSLLTNATRLCEATFGLMWRLEGGVAFPVAELHAPPAFLQFLQSAPHQLNPGTPLARAIETHQPVHIPDIKASPAYRSGEPFVVHATDLSGARTLLIVPMMKDDDAIGYIAIYRNEVHAFNDKQIELVQNFAAQAVIAIENTRLLSELRQRTDDLSESLEQQTATSEVLKVISSSPGDLQPVFQAMLENAVRICEAKFGTLFRYDGASFYRVAGIGVPGELVAYQRQRGSFTPTGDDDPLSRMSREKILVHVADEMLSSTPSPPAKLGGARSLVAVPMLKDDELIGAFVIYRQEVRPFTEKQIELVQNFAAQAVIAIENTRLLNELRQRTDDLTEALEQQTATSEVLKVISSSPGELRPVFQTMLDNATRICGAGFGTLFRVENGEFEPVAHHNVPAVLEKHLAERGRIKPRPGSTMERVMRTRNVVHVADLLQDADAPGNPAVKYANARTYVGVPMLKDEELIGAIVIYRLEVQPFTDKQIELVQNFAAQAVIAIENTRLLNELRQRTDDLSEALEQQTATSEVLNAISNSVSDAQPVFEAIVQSGMRLFPNDAVFIAIPDNGLLKPAAMAERDPARAEAWHKRFPFPLTRDYMHGLAILDRTIVDIADVTHAPPEFATGAKNFLASGYRAVTIVPMMRGDAAIGALSVVRLAPGPLTDKQLAVLKSFAAQAVIAIENTRLLNELRQRTDDLTEALEQQTATSEVLKVISSSPGDLQPVFEAMLENATRICEAKFGSMYLREGDDYRIVAMHNAPSAFAEARTRQPLVRPAPGTGMHRVVTTKQVVHIADDAASPSPGAPARLAGARSTLSVPLLRDKELIGAFTIYRQEVRPFTDKQIELVQNFAAQAVIAIENTRLLNELRESLQQQTATADVLQVISRSQGDLEPVFNTILENAVRICGAKFGNLVLAEGECFRTVALFGAPQSFLEERRREPVIRPRPGSDLDQIRITKKIMHVADMQVSGAASTAIVELAGARTFLNVPMLKENELVGSIGIYRQEVQLFTDKQVELVQNFANQAVIAIENTRLLNELRQRTDELSKSLENLETAQDRLVQTQKLASLGQLTAGIAHEIKNPLNFVNNFSSLSTELLDELREALQSLPIDHKARTEIDELTETLRANLDKIEQHGKRADSIVKNMLLHSREGSGEHRPVDINAVVEESLNLAYHGARAEKQGFNITLERSFDPGAGEVDVFPQEITRVLLNLIANGFYAATKRKEQAGDGYEPTLSAATKNLGDRVEIRIRDNGTGIPLEVKDKMFNPFFTTKPAGEGTGLGLSLSHDIIVKQHAGSIEVDTEPGAFTEIRIVLPRTAASLAKSGGQA